MEESEINEESIIEAFFGTTVCSPNKLHDAKIMSQVDKAILILKKIISLKKDQPKQ